MNENAPELHENAAEQFDFDLDQATRQAWEQFQGRLSEVLSMMDDTGDLVIGSATAIDDDVAGSVRFHYENGRIEALATGNDVVSPEYRITEQAFDTITGQGWRAVNGNEGPFTTSVLQDDTEQLAAMTVGALRDGYGVQHPVFLAPDQLSEILTPTEGKETVPLSEFDATKVAAVLPQNLRHLDALIEAELTERYGYPPMRDDAGDIAIRAGSSMVFLRTSDDARELLIFATLVHNLAGRSRAAEVLNDLNDEARWVKFKAVRDRVLLTYSVMTHPFVPAHLHQAVTLVTNIADSIDDDLAEKLGGHTTFEDDGS